MFKKALLLATVFSVLILSNCSSDDSSSQADSPDNSVSTIQLDNNTTGPKGILKLNIYEEESKQSIPYNIDFANKTTLPDIDMTIDSFKISGTCSDGSSFSLLTSLNNIEIRNMSVGRWIIKIESLNTDKTGIGYGEGWVEIRESEKSELLIAVLPHNGFGIIQITVEWEAEIDNPSIEGSIARSNSTIFDLQFEIIGNTATAEITGAAGYYLLSVNLYDVEGEVHPYVGGAVEVVRIVKDEITPGVFYINANSEYGYGDIEIGIDVDMKDPIDIALRGQVASYNIGSTMTVMASSSGESSPVTYTWYLNGELVQTDYIDDPANDDSSYTTRSTLPAGPYRLDVTAFNDSGDRAGSVNYHFQVLPEAPSNLSYSENPAVYTVGIPITDNIATVTGEGCTFSVFPDLPQGLTLDENTGLISGTPLAAQTETVHTVYAENYGGSTSYDLTITVNIVIPALSVTETGEDLITLSWTYNYPNISGYEVYRSTTQGDYDYTSPLTVITSGETTGTHTDLTVDSETTYYYVVRAYYGFNYTQDSNEVSATTQSAGTEGELKSRWPFEGNVLDVEGENDGTRNGDVLPAYTEGVKGLPNTAIKLSSTDSSYVDFGLDTFAIEETNEFTVAFWLRLDSTSASSILRRGEYAYPFIISRYSSSDNIIRWIVRTDDTHYFYGNEHLNIGEWYHVTVNYGNGYTKLFINGIEDNSGELTGDLYTGLSDSNLVLGGGSWGSNSDISISDLRIYNHALSDTEVTDLFNTANNNNCVFSCIRPSGYSLSTAEQAKYGSNVYDSLSAWNSARARDLVAADESEICEIIHGNGWTNSDTSGVNLYSTFVTDTDHRIIIRTTPESRHNGVWDDTKYRLATSGCDSIRIRADYVRIEGLQISNEATGWQHIALQVEDQSSDNLIELCNNIVKGLHSGVMDYHSGIELIESTINAKIWNNIIYGYDSGGTGNIGIWPHYYNTAYIFNNTVINCSAGIYSSNDGTCTSINNLVSNCSTNFSWSFSSESDYNASDDNTNAGGTHDRTNQTFTFIDPASEDYRLAHSDKGATDCGADLRSDANIFFNDDTAGNTRTGTWNIGASEEYSITYSCVRPSGYTLTAEEQIKYGSNVYDTLIAWFSGRARNLVTADETEICEIINGNGWSNPDTSAVHFYPTGYFITDYDHRIIVRTTPQARHSGVWDNTRYRLEVSGDDSFEIQSDYVRIEGLQVLNNATDWGHIAFQICDQTADNLIEICYNIIKGTHSTTLDFHSGIQLGENTINAKIWNNLIYGFNSGAENCGIFDYSSNSAFLYNNSIADCIRGILSYGTGTCTAINNLVSGCSEYNFNSISGFNLNSDFNASDDATSTGYTNDRINQTFTFIDSVNENYILSSTDTAAKDFGIDLSSDANILFNDDIAGNSRSGSWDIGASEAQ
ncbi:MAG: putative Ig domain-containing protein [Spirochaetes bacterium]|nr:putative Ig domain-containing protein [Spirochaetota bacterium]